MASPVLSEPIPHAFGRIVVGVDGSAASVEAAHQAAHLAGPGGSLTLLTVSADGDAWSRPALEAACIAARVEGVEPRTATVDAPNVGDAMLAAAERAELVVFGAHNHSRLSGIVLGHVTARALHMSRTPVLVARSRPEVGFPGVILTATAGAADRGTTIVAATIAAQLRTRVVLAHVGPSDQTLRHALAVQAADILQITGTDPVVVNVGGSPAARLPAMADAVDAGLLVLGSHGLRGPRALASVSERVAHRAPCSVLVLRSSREP